MAKKSLHSILRGKYPEGEYVLMSEVSDTAGASRNRSLDYMAVSLWPSRGLSVIGIEVKSHRSDWLREMKNPLKQENHFQYCDYFYLLTDNEGVAKLEEIPETWGWFVVKNDKIYQMKAAPKLEAKPIGRSFLTAMLKRAGSKDKYVHVDTIEENIQKRAEQLMVQQERNVKYQLEEYERLKIKVKEFAEHSGIDVFDRTAFRYAPLKDIGNAVRFIMNNDIQAYKKDIERLKKSADIIQKNLTNALNSIETINFNKPENTEEEN